MPSLPHGTTASSCPRSLALQSVGLHSNASAMPTATLDGATIAKGDATAVEGNRYFHPDAVDQTSLSKSSTTTQCPWKGAA